MVARNDVTGHAIKSRVSESPDFASNWDAIFGKKDKVDETAVEEIPSDEVHEDSTGQQ